MICKKCGKDNQYRRIIKPTVENYISFRCVYCQTIREFSLEETGNLLQNYFELVNRMTLLNEFLTGVNHD